MISITPIITCFIVLLLPGIAILVWIKHESIGVAACLADCIGLSISITTVLFLITFYTPLRITSTFLTILYSLCAIISLAGILHRRIKLHWSWEIPITLFLFGVVIALRFYQVRGLLLPAWVDSIHHTLITKVIIEQGAIPITLAPYLNVPFSYYFGFHGLAAAYSQISGLPAEKAILFLGQVLNACVPLAVYRLGCALWEKRDKALIAALLVAFISQMPAYYVTWGRYTLLTGMLLLPLAMAELIEFNRPATQKRHLVQLPLLFIGMTLSHYFSSLLFILFSLIHGIVGFFQVGRRVTQNAVKTTAVILIGFVIVAPWLIRAYQLTSYNMKIALNLQTTPAGWQSIALYSHYLLTLSGPVRNYVFLVLGFLGLVPFLQDRYVRSLAIWAVLILMAALPVGIDLPNIRPDHMIIILFLPLSLSAAELLANTSRFLSERVHQKRVYPVLLSPLLIVLCAWGIVETREIINPETIFVSQADISAIEWVRAHLPSNARFLINSTHWQGSTYRGVDGGYWLLPLTGNFTLPPPVIYAWGNHESVQSMNAMGKVVSELTRCDIKFWETVSEEKITYVYVKEGVGSLQPNALLLCSSLKLVYAADGVSIFNVK